MAKMVGIFVANFHSACTMFFKSSIFVGISVLIVSMLSVVAAGGEFELLVGFVLGLMTTALVCYLLGRIKKNEVVDGIKVEEGVVVDNPSDLMFLYGILGLRERIEEMFRPIVLTWDYQDLGFRNFEDLPPVSELLRM